MSKKRKKTVDNKSRLKRYKMLNDDHLHDMNYTYETDGQKLRIAKILRFMDDQLTYNQLWERFNVCPKHHMILSPELKCNEMDCNYNQFIEYIPKITTHSKLILKLYPDGKLLHYKRFNEISKKWIDVPQKPY